MKYTFKSSLTISDFKLLTSDSFSKSNGISFIYEGSMDTSAIGSASKSSCAVICVISPSSAVIRHDVFDNIGLFDESLKACEDYEFWLRFCAREPVVFVDQPLVQKFGGHDDQLSRRTIGLDRYRVKSLQTLLESGILNPQQRSLTTAM